MEKLVIISSVTNEVVIVTLSEEQAAIEEQYDTTDEWLASEDIGEKLGIDLNYCQYLWMEENISTREVTL